MRRLLGVFVLLVLAGGVGTLIARDPGYVLIAWRDASLETSVWFALVLLLLLLLALRTLLVIFGFVFGSRRGVREWNRRRLERRAQRATTTGLVALAEGDFVPARKALTRSAERLDAPLVNLLGAARAAHELDDLEGRDALLQQALESSPKAALAVGITQAELQISRRQWEQALATLLSLRAQAPRNGYVLRMLRSTYQALEDWQGLLGVIAELRKTGAISDEEIAELEQRTWQAELERSSRIDLPEEARLRALESSWEKVPKGLKSDPVLLETYVRELLVLGADDAAETLVRRTLRKSWHDPLVALYGLIPAANAEQQLVAAQSWVPERPNNETLLLTLGRLCVRNERLARGREYLEASLQQRRTAAACAELGRLCARLGEQELAAQLLEEALALGNDLLLPSLLPAPLPAPLPEVNQAS